MLTIKTKLGKNKKLIISNPKAITTVDFRTGNAPTHNQTTESARQRRLIPWLFHLKELMTRKNRSTARKEPVHKGVTPKESIKNRHSLRKTVEPITVTKTKIK